jgi:hypothetical protein
MTDFINDLIPLLIPALLSVVTWFVTRALIAVRERFGAETERILRQELDKAMARGIAVAATRRRAGGADAYLDGQRAAAYVLETMPRTVARLGADYEAVIERAKAQIVLTMGRPTVGGNLADLGEPKTPPDTAR